MEGRERNEGNGEKGEETGWEEKEGGRRNLLPPNENP
jgi:hypothetical protein